MEKTVHRYLGLFPVIGLSGPRQSGKSTMLRRILPEFRYVTFDDPLAVRFFEDDPAAFLIRHEGKVFFDEIQRVPELFHYLKITVDEDRGAYGRFVLTGSNQFHLMKNIGESLAGRIGLLSLLPFQYNEVPAPVRTALTLGGSYPEIVLRGHKGWVEWYSSYFQNYLEKDIRGIFNIGNLRDYQKFVAFIAAHTSQELNMSETSRDLGISLGTVKNWISILEASYIIFLVPPYHENLGKRIVKRPRLYFYDTGLVSYLCGIRDINHLEQGPMAGALFENYLIAESRKAILHTGRDAAIYYLRTNTGLEVDLIIDDREAGIVTWTEIKKNATLKPEMLKPLRTLLDLQTNTAIRSPASARHRGLLLYNGKTERIDDRLTAVNAQEWLTGL